MASYSSDVPSMGLLTSFSNGVKDALTSYQTLQNQKHSQQLQELTSGVTRDENGDLTLTPQAQAQRDFAAKKNQDEMDQYSQSHDVNSPYSQNVAKTHNAMYKTYGIDGVDTTGMNAAQIEEMDKGLLSPAAAFAGARAKADASRYGADTRATSAEDTAATRAQAMKDTAQQRANAPLTPYQQERMGLMKDNLEMRKQDRVTKAGKEFDTDPMMMQINKTQQSLDRANEIMNGKTPVTSANFAMLQQDLINAVSPGGAATEGKVNREMVEPVIGKLNELMQNYGDIQDLRKQAPEQFKQLQGMLDQLHNGYKEAQARRYGELAEKYQGNTMPGIQGLIQTKQQRFNPQSAAGVGAGGPPVSSGPMNTDSSVVQMRDPKGNIRAIPASQVKAALAAGGTMVGQ